MTSQRRVIGYWRNAEHPEYPDPADLVDDSWEEDERGVVEWHLSGGAVSIAFMGLSPCRLCGEANGALEITDGVYQWPEGLIHYVRDHGVRLPREFVEHVLVRQDQLNDHVRDLSWWLDSTKISDKGIS